MTTDRYIVDFTNREGTSDETVSVSRWEGQSLAAFLGFVVDTIDVLRDGKVYRITSEYGEVVYEVAR